MAKLLVVESPNKVKTIQKYLDSSEPGKWRVVASVGHWRGLPDMGGQAFADVVEVSGGWAENFEVHNRDVERRLRQAVAAANEVYLATDPDREGEAIAWHIADHFRLRNPKRIRFHEITQTAIAAAIRNPDSIDFNLVEAQRCRAVLDYLVGMEVSRRLWRFGAKSAGRVQSCALRTVVDREKVILGFSPEQFWTVASKYKEGFTAQLATFEMPDDDELDQTDGTDRTPRLIARRFSSEAEARAVVEQGRGAPHVIENITAESCLRKPPAPFTTASLLTAGVDLGLKPDEVSSIAQRLFERGLVTYIRTDSVALSDDAIADIRGYLRKKHQHLLPSEPIRHAERGAGTQGAHEAIRPTHIDNPDAAALVGVDKQLYDLIRNRTIVCQAAPAELERTTITIDPRGRTWRLLAHGTIMRKAGWLELERCSGSSEEDSILPALSKGQELGLLDLAAKGGKTKPPPRFTLKTLIRYLERKGIGRPSTYSLMVSTLFERGYLEEKGKNLVPGSIGLVADELVRLGFDKISREDFTAVTERSLDKIAAGQMKRVAFLQTFYDGFCKLIEQAGPAFEGWARAHPESDREAKIPHDKACPKCGSAMLRRAGKHGPYAKCTDESCSQVVNLTPLRELKQPCPKCGGSVLEQPYIKDGKRSVFYRCSGEGCGWKSSHPPPRVGKEPCPHCGAKMFLKQIEKDKFWSCSTYPECRGRRSYERRSKKKK